MSIPKLMAAEQVHEVVLSILKDKERGKILDATAGEGHLILKLIDMGFDVVPCDINSKNFKACGINVDELNLNEMLPYEMNTFDHIFSVESIKHIENPRNLMRNFNNVLKPSGELILTTPNICNISSRAPFLMKCDFHRFGEYEDHITPLPWFILKRLLEKNDFIIGAVLTNNFIRPCRSSVFYLLYPFFSNKGPVILFGDILIIKAKKVKI